MSDSFKPFNNHFKGKSFISIDQLSSAAELRKIFKEARRMEKIVLKRKPSNLLKGYCVAELFYQPSTRTFTSFLAAAEWLGAITIPIHGMSSYSSVVKGETIEDTVRSVHQTTAADLIIMRHPDNDSTEIAAKYSYVPIISGGAGTKEHPTQAILDLYTIEKELGRTNNLKVIFMGDLKYGRTIKSLGKLLTLMDKKLQLFLVSPKILRMPEDLVKEWKSQGVKIVETDNLQEIIPEADILYATRVQKEWFEKEGKLDLYEKVRHSFDINLNTLKKAKKKMIIMHPLPRVGEIAYEVDNDPRAVYLPQMRAGLYTRMALMKLILLGDK